MTQITFWAFYPARDGYILEYHTNNRQLIANHVILDEGGGLIYYEGQYGYDSKDYSEKYMCGDRYEVLDQYQGRKCDFQTTHWLDGTYSWQLSINGMALIKLWRVDHNVHMQLIDTEIVRNLPTEYQKWQLKYPARRYLNDSFQLKGPLEGFIKDSDWIYVHSVVQTEPGWVYLSIPSTHRWKYRWRHLMY